MSYLKEIRIQIADREIQIKDLREQKKECQIQFSINRADLPKPINSIKNLKYWGDIYDRFAHGKRIDINK